MLKKIKHLTGEELFILTNMANINYDNLNEYVDNNMDLGDLKYSNLLYDSSLPENKKVQFPVDKIYDQLMFDNYATYQKVKGRMAELSQMNEEDFGFMDERSKDAFEQSREHVGQFVKLYEKLLMISKFEFPNIRQVQKYLLEEELKKQIRIENYEACIEIKKSLSQV